MEPKIGDIIELTSEVNVGEALFKVGTQCKIRSIFHNKIVCYSVYPHNDYNFRFPITLVDAQYKLENDPITPPCVLVEEAAKQLDPKPKPNTYKVGDIIKYIGPDRHAFDGIKTELVVHGQILFINEIDEYGITANTQNTNHLEHKMNLRIGPEHIGELEKTNSCKMDVEAMKIQNQISEAMAYKPRDKTDLIEHWQLKTEKETVDHPAYYNTGKIECIQYIQELGMAEDFCSGNAIKYISRYKHKGNPIEDLKKSKWYIEKLIEILESKEASK